MIAILALVLSGECLAQAPASSSRDEGKQTIKIWSKDPFVPPFIPKTELQQTKAEHLPDLELTSILYNDTRSAAIINGRLVHGGDLVQGNKILDIQRTHVILGDNYKRFRLELKK